MFVIEKLGLSRFARVVRNVGVAALSLLILSSVVTYAASSPGEAIAAKTVERASHKGAETIEGRILLGHEPAAGTMVRVALRRGAKCAGQCETVEMVPVGPQGRFRVPVGPGRYVVVIRRPGATKGIRVQVEPGHSIFISATVEPGGGAPAIAPVIFNY